MGLEAQEIGFYILVSMLIRLASLHDGENPVAEELDAESLGLDPAMYSAPVKVTGQIDNLGSMLNVDVHISAVAKAVCDRCAIEFERPCETEMRVHILFRKAEDEEEAEAEGLVFAGKNPAEVDLSQEVLDAILLEWPMLVYCKEDCKGLCFRCGADLNEGPCTCNTEEVH